MRIIGSEKNVCAKNILNVCDKKIFIFRAKNVFIIKFIFHGYIRQQHLISHNISATYNFHENYSYYTKIYFRWYFFFHERNGHKYVNRTGDIRRDNCYTDRAVWRFSAPRTSLPSNGSDRLAEWRTTTTKVSSVDRASDLLSVYSVDIRFTICRQYSLGSGLIDRTKNYKLLWSTIGNDKFFVD